MATIPDKAFFRIGEAARLVGVEPHVLRYWEEEFSGQIRPGRSAGNQRVYRRQDVERFLEIKALRYHEKLHVEGARRRLRAGAGESLPPAVERIHERVRDEVAALLAIIDEDEAAE